MNAWQRIWREISYRLCKKRTFAMDADSFESLRLIAEREGSQPHEVAARLVQAAVKEQAVSAYVQERWNTLSPREKQITALICRGYTGRQIASLLGLAPTTVKTHAENCLRKFNAPSREALRQLLAGWDLSQYE